MAHAVYGPSLGLFLARTVSRADRSRQLRRERMTVGVLPAMVPKTGKPGFRWGGMRIGVDIGGTKIEAAALDPSDQVAARLRVPTPRGDYPATVEAVAGIVRAIERETGCQGTVGVDMLGSISPTTGLIKGSNSVWMTGHPFRDGLEAALSRPVRCANDANCASVEDASLSRARHKHVCSAYLFVG